MSLGIGPSHLEKNSSLLKQYFHLELFVRTLLTFESNKNGKYHRKLETGTKKKKNIKTIAAIDFAMNENINIIQISITNNTQAFFRTLG